MSKLLKKILSAAIFPAALMIVSKVLGMALANRIFDLGWSVQSNTTGLFSIQILYPDRQSAIQCNSYSNLFMITCLLIGVGVTLFQGYFLHSSHQNPKVLIKMLKFDFLVWLSDTPTIFPNMAVWLAFLWTGTVICITQSLQDFTYPWISVFAIVASIVVTWLGVRDLERELDTILPKNGKLNI
ncbi:hypothetical protein JW710_03580 [Candidatus Dojkabacteria bacterium]|nr:hypothetical protein [Candidatus Dojkabacteria bacterium]